METLAFYACRHGRPTDHPYFSLDGKTHLTAEQWAPLRAKWRHEHAITNVWREPAVRGAERLKVKGSKSLHSNQKPLKLIEATVRACTDPGDHVWDPFAGLATVGVVALRNGRRYCGAEISREVFTAAQARLEQEVRDIDAKTTRDECPASSDRAA
ncbi:MAG: DNA methyltransferase [Solirubrobacteraceae bacterium]